MYIAYMNWTTVQYKFMFTVWYDKVSFLRSHQTTKVETVKVHETFTSFIKIEKIFPYITKIYQRMLETYNYPFSLIQLIKYILQFNKLSA